MHQNKSKPTHQTRPGLLPRNWEQTSEGRLPSSDDFCHVQIRLHEVYDVVDHIVLVESATTHQNKPKPLHYKENAAHFARFADKIIHIALDDLLGDAIPDWFSPLQIAFQKCVFALFTTFAELSLCTSAASPGIACTFCSRCLT